MSNLTSVCLEQLKTRGQFTFLGDDGYIIQANNLDGVLAVVVTNSQDEIEFDHYADFQCLLNHLKAHGGHLHH